MLNPIFEYKIYHPSLQSYYLDRGHAQTMWTAMGEGGQRNVQSTNKAYLVKLSTKGGGGSKKSKKWSTWFVYVLIGSLFCFKQSKGTYESLFESLPFRSDLPDLDLPFQWSCLKDDDDFS